jgi:hypothetical protein
VQSGLQELEREMDRYRDMNEVASGDQFVTIFQPFSNTAKIAMNQLQDAVDQMTQAYDRTLALFGETPKDVSSEEFFGIFRTFATSFNTALTELYAARNRMNRRKAAVQSSTDSEAPMGETDESSLMDLKPAPSLPGTFFIINPTQKRRAGW